MRTRASLGKLNKVFAVLLACVMLVCSFSVLAFAENTTAADSGNDSDPVLAGAVAVTAADIAAGDYEVDVRTSSRTLRVEEAVLHAGADGMELSFYIAGDPYVALYNGPASDASVVEFMLLGAGDDGHIHFSVPVEALEEPVNIAVYSSAREIWYDRTIVVSAEGLPEGAVSVELPDYDELRANAAQNAIDAAGVTENTLPEEGEAVGDILVLEAGSYTCEIMMEGGTGRASVESPAELTVSEDGTMTVVFTWSSPYFDRMRIGEDCFYPVNDEGDSVFEIPVPIAGAWFHAFAETTAMSTPHEIEYAFAITNVVEREAEASRPVPPIVLYLVAAVIALGAGALMMRYYSKKQKR